MSTLIFYSVPASVVKSGKFLKLFHNHDAMDSLDQNPKHPRHTFVKILKKLKYDPRETDRLLKKFNDECQLAITKDESPKEVVSYCMIDASANLTYLDGANQVLMHHLPHERAHSPHSFTNWPVKRMEQWLVFRNVLAHALGIQHSATYSYDLGPYILYVPYTFTRPVFGTENVGIGLGVGPLKFTVDAARVHRKHVPSEERRLDHWCRTGNRYMDALFHESTDQFVKHMHDMHDRYKKGSYCLFAFDVSRDKSILITVDGMHALDAFWSKGSVENAEAFARTVTRALSEQLDTKLSEFQHYNETEGIFRHCQEGAQGSADSLQWLLKNTEGKGNREEDRFERVVKTCKNAALERKHRSKTRE
jgi:hypothetical protein